MTNLVFKVCDPHKRSHEYCANESIVVEEAYWKGQLAYVVVRFEDPYLNPSERYVYTCGSFFPHGAFKCVSNLHSDEAARKVIRDMVVEFEKWLQAQWFRKKVPQ